MGNLLIIPQPGDGGAVICPASARLTACFCPQIQNVDACLSFLDARGVNVQGLSAEGKDRSAPQPLNPAKLRTWVDRAFSVAAPSPWNSLLNHIRPASTLQSFNQALKTHLSKVTFFSPLLPLNYS